METKYNHKKTKEIKRQLIVFLMISKMVSFALKHVSFIPLLQILPIITYDRWNRLSFIVDKFRVNYSPNWKSIDLIKEFCASHSKVRS